MILAGLLAALLLAEDTYGDLAGDILDLYDAHQVVALADHHGETGDAALRTAIFHHPEFHRRVDVIVLEFLNAHWQAEIDRYLGGEDIPPEIVQRFWRDTRHDVWESPVYADMLRTLRARLAAVPVAERPRVLAGNAPVDWDGAMPGDAIIDGRAALDYPARLIICQAFRRDRTALVIFGPGHIYHDYRWSFMPLLDQESPGASAVVVQPVWSASSRQHLASDLGLGRSPALVPIDLWPGAARDVTGLISGQDSDPALPARDAIDYLTWLGDHVEDRLTADEAALADPDLASLRERQSAIRNAAPGPVRWARAPGFDPECDDL